MADQYRKPYFDSSAFIAWIKGEVQGDVNRRAIVDHILRLAEHGTFQIFTSTLTLAEVHKRRSGPVLSNEEDDKILRYFEREHIQLVEVDREIGEHANRLCREYTENRLYPNDAIHLACALRAGCDVVLAWDQRLTKIQHSGIKLEEPRVIGQKNWTFRIVQQRNGVARATK